MTNTNKQSDEELRFGFGKNWQSFLETVTDENINDAKQDILNWLDPQDIENKRVIDVGSGSGIHSYCLHQLGAGELISFDYDENSVNGTRYMHQKAGAPDNWSVMQGSALDGAFISGLGQFDLVYSWGVLHHTGSMWEAIDNAASLVKPGGFLWITLYTKGPRYQKHLQLKRSYQTSSTFGKKLMLVWHLFLQAIKLAVRFKNPLGLWTKRARGMSAVHDTADWLGGLPYEVASADETVTFLGEKGFTLKRINAREEGSCSGYIFEKK